jgi:hypothetical protein
MGITEQIAANNAAYNDFAEKNYNRLSAHKDSDGIKNAIGFYFIMQEAVNSARIHDESERKNFDYEGYIHALADAQERDVWNVALNSGNYFVGAVKNLISGATREEIAAQ